MPLCNRHRSAMIAMVWRSSLMGGATGFLRRFNIALNDTPIGPGRGDLKQIKPGLFGHVARQRRCIYAIGAHSAAS